MRLLLSYLLYNVARVFTLSDVRVWASKLGYSVDRRRLHDAAVRLVERGILERVRRGLYRVVDWAALRAYASTRLDKVAAAAPRQGDRGVPGGHTLVRLQCAATGPGFSRRL